MEKAFEPIRRSHYALTEQLRIAGGTSRIQEIAGANQRLMSAFDGIKIDTRWVSEFSKVHTSWLRSMQLDQDHITRLQASAKLTLSVSSQMATIAERFHAGVDFTRLSQLLRVQDNVVAQLRTECGAMAREYGLFGRSIEPIERLTALPSFLVPSASREMLVEGRALAVLTEVGDTKAEDHDVADISVIRDELTEVVDLLSSVNPSLAGAYRGAREAFSGSNTDRKRHVLASLREMWGHLLREIAPDEKVVPWTSGKGVELLHEGKPTRKARVLYVCREINHGPLTEFVNADTGALVKLVELFNRVHELEPGISDAQLSALMLRTDSWLKFIVQISREGK